MRLDAEVHGVDVPLQLARRRKVCAAQRLRAGVVAARQPVGVTGRRILHLVLVISDCNGGRALLSLLAGAARALAPPFGRWRAAASPADTAARLGIGDRATTKPQSLGNCAR